MFAQLGPIRFDVLSHVEGFDIARSQTYAEHEVIEGKPKLQWIGEALDEIALDLSFHAAFCTPEVEMQKLERAASAHQALPLVFGDGRYIGRFVITRIDRALRFCDGRGRAFQIEAKVSLREYAGEGVETPEGLAVAAVQTLALAVKPVPPGDNPDAVPSRDIVRGVA